jgi:hypothetical protein
MLDKMDSTSLFVCSDIFPWQNMRRGCGHRLHGEWRPQHPATLPSLACWSAQVCLPQLTCSTHASTAWLAGQGSGSTDRVAWPTSHDVMQQGGSPRRDHDSPCRSLQDLGCNNCILFCVLPLWPV